MCGLGLVVLLLGASEGKAFAAEDPKVNVTLSLPFARDQIKELRYAGKPLIPDRVVHAGAVTRLVILGAARGAEDSAMVKELDAAVAVCPECFADVQIWSTGRDQHLLQPPKRLISRMDILDVLLSAFTGKGPVEIYWIDVAFEWTDCRGAEWCYYSTLTERLLQIGDAGATIFPIVTPVKGRHPGDLKFLAKLTGTRPRVAQVGRPGLALAEALRDSKRHVVVDFAIPGKAAKVFGPGSPHLEVLGDNGVMSSRPFAVSQRKSTDEEKTAILSDQLNPYPPRVAIESAKLARSCNHGVQFDAGTATTRQSDDLYLSLAGVNLPEARSIDPKAYQVLTIQADLNQQGERGLWRHGEPLEWVQKGSTACVGPLNGIQAGDYVFWEKNFRWKAEVSIRRP
ncbi:hypothetical protein F183_A38200 [Bryobacterales bacterium F-183]|nr:hypothetical protein F183_A38200 [Bryobacterales bacterium F-183]